MRLSKDKTSLAYNEFLTLKGIPLETYEYRLGNRCALEWVIDQYQVSTDKRSGIVNDPNRAGSSPSAWRRLEVVGSLSVLVISDATSGGAKGRGALTWWAQME